MVAVCGEEVERRLRVGADARRAWERDGMLQTVPAWADGDPEAGMNVPGGYYSTPGRGAIPEWPNRLAVLSWTDWVGFDAVALAPQVEVQTLFVHSDGSALPANVRTAADSLGGPASVLWTQGGHFDFYDQGPQLSLPPTSPPRSCAPPSDPHGRAARPAGDQTGTTALRDDVTPATAPGRGRLP